MDKDDLPGMLAVAKGVAEQTWPHTVDAQMWAKEFVKQYPGFDEGEAIDWCANAIMAGYDTAQSRAADALSRSRDGAHVHAQDAQNWGHCVHCGQRIESSAPRADALSRSRDEAHDIERAYQVLELYGVPRERELTS